MFSPNMVRYIIDPDNNMDETGENKSNLCERQIFKRNIQNHEKILNECNFFSLIFGKIGKLFADFAFNTK